MVTSIVALKQPCPRNLGVWTCDKCQAEYESLDGYYGLPDEIHCYETFGDKICGITHLGIVWCDECVANGNNEKRVSHIAEYVTVGRIKTLDESFIV